MLEKVLIEFSKLFQRIGAVWLTEIFNILREDVEGWSRVRESEECMKTVGLIFISFLRYWGLEVWRRS